MTPNRPISMEELLRTIQAQLASNQNEPAPTEAPEVALKTQFPVGSEVEVVCGEHKYLRPGSWGIVKGYQPDEQGDISVVVSYNRVNSPKFTEKLPVEKASPPACLKLLAADSIKPGLKRVEWESVILPDELKNTIQAAVDQCKNYHKIFDVWGLSKVFEKGYGITLLFQGPPGTGKTLAAEALSWQLKKELIIADTGSLQDCKIGEMEKNTDRMFDKATNQDLILLFDEADSMLSNREFKGPILSAETNHLMTRIERFPGVCIFTTNRAAELDPAVERRITMKFEFKEPTEDERKKIWRRMIPMECPLGPEINFEQLARPAITGGMIKNIVLNAAREAAFKGAEMIEWDHMRKAMENEIDGHKMFANRRKRDPHFYQMGSATNVRTTERLSDFSSDDGSESGQSA